MKSRKPPVQNLWVSPVLTTFCIRTARHDYVSLVATGLELGGKDPAYVRPDADLDYTVEQLVDGSFFNSGQCCCAIERIYVHEDIYDRFLEKFVALTKVCWHLTVMF